jgi:ABC-type transporter Mla MlaB component
MDAARLRIHQDIPMNTLSIGPQLGIENVAALREQLVKPARSKSPVTLTFERIDQVHTAALQVLCAFVRDRAAAKGTTRIQAPDELRNAAQLLGVSDLLGLTNTGELT